MSQALAKPMQRCQFHMPSSHGGKRLFLKPLAEMDNLIAQETHGSKMAFLDGAPPGRSADLDVHSIALQICNAIPIRLTRRNVMQKLLRPSASMPRG